MSEYLRILIIVCPLIGLAGFIDAIAGGGGLISLPAYLLSGLPAHTAHGTGKFSSACGLASASYKYLKEGTVRMSVALYSAIGCLAGAYIGTSLAIFLPEKTLRMVMLIAIPIVAVFLATKKDIGTNVSEVKLDKTKEAVLSAVIGLVVGIYDGLIGPGAGTFLILGFTSFLGIDLVMSSACAKVSNFASNITSVVLYALRGNILYHVAVPAALCSMLGSYMGAKQAVKGGSARVKKMMYVVLVLLFVKLAYDLFMG
ncbi:MAG: sulfite exporter TauE/SafE family protein [Clostridia bacterium]|nr:sulfite exporter TauE/SafE family protein [Clostridia bacterium]